MDKYTCGCRDTLAKLCCDSDIKKKDKIQNSPHPHNIPTYGAKVQYAEQSDESPKLDKAGIKYVQQVAGTLLYYGRAVDPTILPALSLIASEQAAPTERTMERVKQLLDYCASQEEAIIILLEFTATRDMRTRKRQEAVRGDIFSFPTTNLIHRTTGQY